MKKLKVLVVDDSLVYRNIITKAVEMTNVAVVDCTASSGITALERLEQREIDSVLLDIYMPEMDGIETLKEINKKYKDLPVIIISSGGEDGARVTVEALEEGAMDFILKPAYGDPKRNMSTISRHLGILFSQIIMDRYTTKKPEIKSKPRPEPKAPRELKKAPVPKPAEKACIDGVDLVVVASSTGGPNALEEVFRYVDPGFSKPILIVQHMPSDFTRVFAGVLGKKTGHWVGEARDGEEIAGGKVLIAPGGHHMVALPGERGSGAKVGITDDDPVNGVRPSADVLFESVAKVYRGRRVLAIILTGMGNDGSRGVEILKKACRCYCITQSEETCVVYGMPRSVDEAGLSDESVDLGEIGNRIMEISRGRC